MVAKQRRSPGEGSVYQRVDGRWEAQIADGYTRGGKRRRRKVVGRTRRETLKRLEALRQEIEGGLLVDGSRMRLAEWVRYWLAEEVKPTVRESTYHNYESTCRVHLVPALGHIRLRDLEPRHIRLYQQQKLADGLAPSTVAIHHQVLRRALEIALRYGYVQRNVGRLVSRPRLVIGDVQPLDRPETARFLRAAKGHRLEALFLLIVATGMRRGEAMGLTWDAVDLDAGFVRVDRTLSRFGRTFRLGPPKTPRSRRAIAIPRPLVEALRRHRERERERELAAGSMWVGNEWNLVFTNRVGAPLEGTVLAETFHYLLRVAGVRRIRLHDLRHGTATFLLSQGVSLKVVQDVLGHAQMSTTADLYAHLVPELRREAADRIAEVLFNND